MDIRVKFTCTEVTRMIGSKYDDNGKYGSGIVYNYKFNVVSSGSEDNKKFFASTPTGNMQFSSVRDDLFEVGKEYYSYLTPAN